MIRQTLLAAIFCCGVACDRNHTPTATPVHEVVAPKTDDVGAVVRARPPIGFDNSFAALKSSIPTWKRAALVSVDPEREAANGEPVELTRDELEVITTAVRDCQPEGDLRSMGGPIFSSVLEIYADSLVGVVWLDQQGLVAELRTPYDLKPATDELSQTDYCVTDDLELLRVFERVYGPTVVEKGLRMPGGPAILLD